MKAINVPVRSKFDRADLKVASTGLRSALKKIARKQVRAAERQLVLREELGGYFKSRAIERAELAETARAQEIAAMRAVARVERNALRSRDLLREQDALQSSIGADLRHLADRVLMETPVTVIRKSGIDTVLVRASCAA